jgi:hypothetical protein
MTQVPTSKTQPDVTKIWLYNSTEEYHCVRKML